VFDFLPVSLSEVVDIQDEEGWAMDEALRVTASDYSRHFGAKMYPAPRHIQRQDILGVKIVASSCPASCYYQSNHSKVEANPSSALPKDTTSELASLSPH